MSDIYAEAVKDIDGVWHGFGYSEKYDPRDDRLWYKLVVDGVPREPVSFSDNSGDLRYRAMEKIANAMDDIDDAILVERAADLFRQHITYAGQTLPGEYVPYGGALVLPTFGGSK